MEYSIVYLYKIENFYKEYHGIWETVKQINWNLWTKSFTEDKLHKEPLDAVFKLLSMCLSVYEILVMIG